MNNPGYNLEQYPPAQSSVHNLRQHLIMVGANDVLGPLRLAQIREDEVQLPDKTRRLLMHFNDYAPYAENFQKAGIRKLEIDNAIGAVDDAVAITVPTDSVVLDRVLATHHTQVKVIGDMLLKTGGIVRRLSNLTGRIPVPNEMTTKKIVVLRREGDVTLLPPVHFVDSTEELMRESVDRLSQDLVKIKKPEAIGYLIERYREGLYGDPQ